MDDAPILLKHDFITNIYSTATKHFKFGNILHQGINGIIRWVRVLNTETHISTFILMKNQYNYPFATLKEARLQRIVHQYLEAHGFHNVVPEVHDILQTTNGQIYFTMTAYEDAVLFSDYLEHNINWGNPSSHNDHILLEIISQIARVLVPLQNELKFNHRDLKTDNILICPGPHAILIDFGLSCIGRRIADPRPIMNAGIRTISDTDPCPKIGRDLFQLFLSLYSFQRIRMSITPEVDNLFKKWLKIGDKSWADIVSRVGESKQEWIYFYLSHEYFAAPNCSPDIVFDALKLFLAKPF